MSFRSRRAQQCCQLIAIVTKVSDRLSLAILESEQSRIDTLTVESEETETHDDENDMSPLTQ
ncbi:hypothetical protein [Yersinia frederiksenii]|uniref:hypothetical protein n=1 Tax=Yersinia frederiksenii TaxID=29484 RepID=UPI000B1C9F53|nr:hypothetical protein [Yersinia frederiksenii]